MRNAARFVGLCWLVTAVQGAQLPEREEYQRTLRGYLATLTESNLSVAVRPMTMPAEKLDLDEQYRFWLLGDQNPSPVGVVLPAREFTLAVIEGTNAVLRPAATAESLAWLAQWKNPVNPYFGDAAVKQRAFVLAVIDLVMLDELHERGGEANRSDYLGGTLIWLTQAYAAARDVVPAEVGSAYEVGLRKFVERLRKWGPTGMMTDMDLFAPVSLWYAGELLGDAATKEFATEYSRRLFTEPRFYHPAGYFVDMGGFDATYNGISLYFATWAGLISDWPFVRTAVTAAYRLRGYLMLPEPDGNWFGPSHFSSRTSADVAHDQWSWPHRHAGAAVLTPAARTAVTVPTTNVLERAGARFVAQWNKALSAAVKAPQPWKEQHWTRGMLGCELAPPGFFAGLQPELPPFAQPGNFIRQFATTFLAAKFEKYGVILHTGVVPKERATAERTYGYSGGGVAAFWTPASGSVILGRRGSFQGNTFDRWPEWRLWPVHAISGLTTNGKVFTSGREPNPMVEYDVQAERAEVRVTGRMPKRNSWQGEALVGEMTYRRRFVVSAAGVEVESTVVMDGADAVAELYEMIPVFLRDGALQKQVKVVNANPGKLDEFADIVRPSLRQKEVPVVIRFRVDADWREATAESAESVSAVRIDRFAGTVLVEFDRPRRVKLSPQVWKDGYQSRAECRNIMIDLRDGAPTIRYRIKP
ncbi:MAG: hypothetical protein PCFJNLEI_02019 [Verrucomicrobiae bacterium]|nr:hypothetical protein [Verrucomicrobiae bacterium]